MKIKFVIISCIFGLLYVDGQNLDNNISFGIKSGINFYGFHTGKSASTDKFGVNAGAVLELPIGKYFSFQPELLYNRKGGRINESGEQTEIRLNYIDVPLLITYYPYSKLGISTGPQLGVLFNGKREINGMKSEVVGENSIDLAWDFGLTYRFSRSFFIHSRYGYGFSEVFKDDKYKNSVISLSLGYYFE